MSTGFISSASTLDRPVASWPPWFPLLFTSWFVSSSSFRCSFFFRPSGRLCRNHLSVAPGAGSTDPKLRLGPAHSNLRREMNAQSYFLRSSETIRLSRGCRGRVRPSIDIRRRPSDRITRTWTFFSPFPSTPMANEGQATHWKRRLTRLVRALTDGLP